MVKRSGSIIAIFLAVMLSVPFTTGCSCSESKQEKETTTTGNETKEESTTTVRVTEEETNTLVDAEEETTTEETITVVDNETSGEETDIIETTLTETTPKVTSSVKNQYTETTTEYEFVEDGYHIWQYRSDIYPDDSEKGRLEEIFWNEYGWTTFGKEKNDQMVMATVELVSNIMNTYSTDFEREKALYESICLNCRYDYDSLETGLTHEGQSAYGVLVEHKAVCGGYSATFGIALTMMGIENELVIGMVSAGLHGWNKVCLEGEWYEVDVTWGDGTGDEYDYTYFNLTTDEMSLDHERRGIECNGTKYGQTYIKKLLREEYLADKVVIDTQEEALKYINEALNSGKTSIEMVFSNADVKNAVRELVKPDYWEEGERYKIYNIDKDSENYYFDFETLWDYENEGIWYNKYTLEGIFRIDIFVTYLNDFREKENYFETLEEFYAYVRAEREKGMHEIKAYLAFTEDEISMINMDTSQFGEGYYGAAYRTACDSDNMVEYTVYFMQ